MARKKLSLEERQRQMKERAAHARAKRAVRYQEIDAERKRQEREAEDLAKEQAEIAQLASGEVKCPYCELENTNLHPRTGQVLPCSSCKQRRQSLYQYKLTLWDFHQMLVQQRNRCAICDNEFTNESRSTKPNVDHCHCNTHVRGLLCGKCNAALGQFQDDDKVLLRAVKYLRLNMMGRRWWFQLDSGSAVEFNDVYNLSDGDSIT